MSRARAVWALPLLLLLPVSSCQSCYSKRDVGPGDLALTRVDLVQGVLGQDVIVAERLAIVRIEVTSTFAADVSVPIERDSALCGGIPGVCPPAPVFPAGSAGPPAFMIHPGSHAYYLGQGGAAPGNAPPLQNPSVCTSVVLDYGNTLPETDENNNEGGSCHPLVATRQLRVFFIPIALGASPAPTCAAVQTIAARTTDFVRGTYPVADSGERALAEFVSCNAQSYPDDFAARRGLENGWRDDNGQPAPPTNIPHHDAFVGVFGVNAFAGGFGIGSQGQPQFGLIFHASLIEESQIDGAGAAQEMAHNFGWVTSDSPFNDGTNHLIPTPAPGYWVAKNCEMGFYRWSVLPSGNPCDPAHVPSEFMSPQGTSRPNDVMKWISKPTWDFLLGSLS